MKEPDLFKLVWRPDEAPLPPPTSPSGSAGAPAPQQQPFDMFQRSAAPAPAAGLVAGGVAPWGGPLPGVSPAAALDAPAAPSSGPLVHQGVEYWEGGVSFEVELLLPSAAEQAAPAAAAGPSEAFGAAAGAGAGAVPAAGALSCGVSCRQMPNGSQLVLVPGGAVAGSAGRGRARHGNTTGGDFAVHAFWLQQRWEPKACLSPIAADAAAGGERAERLLAKARGASDVATAVVALLRHRPAVDLRQLRRDVKEGVLKVC